MSASNSTLDRGLGYYRKSTDDQEASIPEQKKWTHLACGRERINLCREFTDEGISGGKIDQRSELAALLAEAESAAARGEPYDCLVFWNFDRFSRADSIRTAALLARLMDAGVSRIFSIEGWI